MDFSDVVRRRRMAYAFRPDPLDPAGLDRILAAGLRGPSAGFTEGFDLLVLTTEAERGAFWPLLRGNPQPDGVRRAPVVVVPFASKDAYLDRYAEPDKGWTDRDERRWPVPYWYIDCGMAALLLLLAATNEGLASLFFGIPREDWPALRAAFAVPAAYDPIGAVVLGRAAPEAASAAKKRARRPFETAVHRGRW